MRLRTRRLLARRRILFGALVIAGFGCQSRLDGLCDEFFERGTTTKLTMVYRGEARVLTIYAPAMRVRGYMISFDPPGTIDEYAHANGVVVVYPSCCHDDEAFLAVVRDFVEANGCRV